MGDTTGFDRSSARSSLRPCFLAAVFVGMTGVWLLVADDAFAQAYYRLQLKQGEKYLDAANCSDNVALHPGSTYADGACQLWRFVPAGDGWGRLQLKQNGKYLDAVNCSDNVALNPGSDYANGACQLWRFVPAGDGWNRLQLKQNSKYLDAAYCADRVALNLGSTYANGACQLWRFTSAGPSASSAPPPASPAAGPRPAPVTTPVIKVDEQCNQYADNAVREFNRAQNSRACAVRPDARWHGNYDTHYNWCLTASQGARASEEGARRDWLRRCANP
jgi:ricin-type beta-trefoil lectin protein